MTARFSAAVKHCKSYTTKMARDEAPKWYVALGIGTPPTGATARKRPGGRDGHESDADEDEEDEGEEEEENEPDEAEDTDAEEAEGDTNGHGKRKSMAKPAASEAPLGSASSGGAAEE
eukprot:9483013-Pyramimonas_sp.AAC.2